ncbi:hypothetical protein BDB00DRAFT_114942 [Zychaea mexicana]|uniref:uncharacterized protein n=1 Tax=Zychaea mexicana TaxID=64656 RepID=UPI0022FE3DE8|nr:uncharacterized protein BDB00DRAFT_114942 [Zychaea mexicana]KAI9484723.1 hypothetical protein BDB00DRAFT_114942 [Zychaea mexicana]
MCARKKILPSLQFIIKTRYLLCLTVLVNCCFTIVAIRQQFSPPSSIPVYATVKVLSSIPSMCCCRSVSPLINKYPLPLLKSTHPSVFYIAPNIVNRFVCFCAVLRSFKAAFKIHWDDQKNNTTNDDFSF